MGAIDVDESSFIMGEPKVKLIYSFFYGEYFPRLIIFFRIGTLSFISFSFLKFLLGRNVYYNTDENLLFYTSSYIVACTMHFIQ